MNVIKYMQRINARLVHLLVVILYNRIRSGGVAAVLLPGGAAAAPRISAGGVFVVVSSFVCCFPASLAFSFPFFDQRSRPREARGPYIIKKRDGWNGPEQWPSSQFAMTLRFNDDDLDEEEVDITTSKSRRRRKNQNNNIIDEGTVDDEDDALDIDPTWQERSRRWILLVDDEVDICKAVGNFLFEQGYQVTTCTNAPTALEIMQRGGDHTKRSSIDRRRQRPVLPYTNYQEFLENEVHEEEQESDDSEQVVKVVRFRPDVIVSDVRMPEMDGIELLTALRSDANLVGIPVVLLTAKSQTQDRIAGYNAGADAYIPKPFDPEELVTIIDNVVARHEQAAATELVWMTNSRGEQVVVAAATTAAAAAAAPDVSVEELQRDLAEIKYLLLEKGGGGVGAGTPGFVQAGGVNHVFLAPDEQQLLELLCQGMMNKEIAAKMYLSTRRVQQLLTELFRKTNVKNRTELVRWAINTGNVQI